jgi:RNA polymerase sigma-70 factor (ECF subfamily)
MSETSDRSLVLRTRRGEVDAYGELVRRYQSSVFNVCYRILAERREAEDLAQEAFIRAYQRLDTFDASRLFGPWIRRVAANLCLNSLRRSQTLILPLDEERDFDGQSQEHNPEAQSIRGEFKRDIREAVLSLPSHFRAVIELRHFQEMSYAEISHALDIPMSDVKSHLFRARRTLAKRLSTYADKS